MACYWSAFLWRTTLERQATAGKQKQGAGRPPVFDFGYFFLAGFLTAFLTTFFLAGFLTVVFLTVVFFFVAVTFAVEEPPEPPDAPDAPEPPDPVLAAATLA